MTEHDYIEANDYGGGTFGAGAYGTDHDPTLTDNHEWPRLSTGSETYPSLFGTLADEIDRALAQYGPQSDRPAAGTDQRVWIDTDGQGLAQVTVDVELDGTWVTPDLPFDLEATAVTRANRAETIVNPWSFEAGVTGDLDGEATHAETVDEAQLANDAEQLGGVDAAQYPAAVNRSTITETWTFTEGAVFRGGLALDDAPVFQLPSHED